MPVAGMIRVLTIRIRPEQQAVQGLTVPDIYADFRRNRSDNATYKRSFPVFDLHQGMLIKVVVKTTIIGKRASLSRAYRKWLIAVTGGQK